MCARGQPETLRLAVVHASGEKSREGAHRRLRLLANTLGVVESCCDARMLMRVCASSGSTCCRHADCDAGQVQLLSGEQVQQLR